MELLSKRLFWLTKYIPISLDGWHRVFSVFAIVMMPVAIIYSHSIPDYRDRSNEYCYFDSSDSYFSVIKCESAIWSAFWNLFHPALSLFMLFSYFLPVVIFIYISAFRGFCILSYMAIINIRRALKSRKFIMIKNYTITLGKKKVF